MLNDKAKENKENSTLNKNELPFKVYSYSLKPGAFMRSYNQKPQNFKFVFFLFSFKFTKLHKGRFALGERIRSKRCQKIYNSFEIYKIQRRSIYLFFFKKKLIIIKIPLIPIKNYSYLEHTELFQIMKVKLWNYKNNIKFRIVRNFLMKDQFG